MRRSPLGERYLQRSLEERGFCEGLRRVTEGRLDGAIRHFGGLDRPLGALLASPHGGKHQGSLKSPVYAPT